MAIDIERFVKLKRFTQEFDLNDTTDQVLPKVGVGSIIYNAIVALINASKQTLGISGNTLSISGGNSVTLPSTPAQTLGISGQTLSISDGNSVTLPDKDQQTLSVSGQTLSISGGNSVTMPSSFAGFGFIVSIFPLPTNYKPADGTWVASPTGSTTLISQITTSGPNNTYILTMNPGDVRYIRGSDGVWYGGTVPGSGLSTITLPSGVTPTQVVSWLISSGGGGGD